MLPTGVLSLSLGDRARARRHTKVVCDHRIYHQVKNITYDVKHLFQYIDQLPDLSLMRPVATASSAPRTQTYQPALHHIHIPTEHMYCSAVAGRWGFGFDSALEQCGALLVCRCTAWHSYDNRSQRYTPYGKKAIKERIFSMLKQQAG